MFNYTQAYETSLKHIQTLKESTHPHSPEPTFGDYILAGSLAGIPTNLLTTPLERIKVVMQTQAQAQARPRLNAGPAPPSMLATGLMLFRTGGLRSLYAGAFATLVRDVPGAAAYYVSYEYVLKGVASVDGGGSGGVNVGASMGALLLAGGTI
jgi:solute carrier family 25 (mitochondrial carnitine/acylcarnitine transporter), member 20/29